MNGVQGNSALETCVKAQT